MSLTTQLNKLLNNISDYYSKVSSSLIYKLMQTVGNEFDISDNQIQLLRDEVHIITATGDALDKIGKDLTTPRSLIEGVWETDEIYRQKLINVFTAKKVTKNSIYSMLLPFVVPGTEPRIEEFSIDRWFLGPEYFQNRVVDEQQISLSSTIVEVSSGIPLEGTRPEVFLLGDPLHTGTDYFGDNGTFIESPVTAGVGRLLLGEALPSDYEDVLVTYTAASTAGSTFETVKVVDEYQTSVTHYVVDIDNQMLFNGVSPKVYLASDILHLGTEYFGDLGAVIESPDKPGYSRLVLQYPLPTLNTAVIVSYYKGTGFDISYGSFFSNDTILRNDNVQNNFTLCEQTSAEITISTRREGKYAGYAVKVDWFDTTNNQIYSWYTSTQASSGLLVLNNSNKIDSKVDNEVVYATAGNSVIVGKAISSVIGVYKSDDLERTVNYYSSFIGSVISLNAPVDEGTVMIAAYYTNPISNYATVPFNRLNPTGDEDIKFTFEVRAVIDNLQQKINTGDVKQPLDIGDTVHGAKAAGVRAFVRLVSIYDSLYGKAKYGKGVYGFTESF